MRQHGVELFLARGVRVPAEFRGGTEDAVIAAKMLPARVITMTLPDGAARFAGDSVIVQVHSEDPYREVFPARGVEKIFDYGMRRCIYSPYYCRQCRQMNGIKVERIRNEQEPAFEDTVFGCSEGHTWSVTL